MFLNLQSSMVVHTFTFLFETILMCQLPESCLANKKKSLCYPRLMFRNQIVLTKSLDRKIYAILHFLCERSIFVPY